MCCRMCQHGGQTCLHCPVLPAAPASSPQHLPPAPLPNQLRMPVPSSPIPRSYTNIVGLQGGVNGFLRVFDARLNPKGAHMWGVCCFAHALMLLDF